MYDDKLVLTYNYKDGSETLTLQEIEAEFEFNRYVSTTKSVAPCGAADFFRGRRTRMVQTARSCCKAGFARRSLYEA